MGTKTTENPGSDTINIEKIKKPWEMEPKQQKQTFLWKSEQQWNFFLGQGVGVGIEKNGGYWGGGRAFRQSVLKTP